VKAPNTRAKNAEDNMSDDTRQLADRQFQELLAELAAGHSQRLVQFLDMTARFHSYSWHNVLLIACQRPEATHVAGYQTWRRLKRQVRRGEKGIAILAPIKRRAIASDDGERSQPDDQFPGTAHRVPAVVGFRAVYVFDVTQTDGPPLATLNDAPQGDPGEYLTILEDAIRADGILLSRAESLGGALGVSQGGAIQVLQSLGSTDVFSVLVHEWAHEQLHKGSDRSTLSRTVRETEAEAVAHIVTAAIGLRASMHSADYIALYRGDADLLRASLSRIQTTAARILERLGVGRPGETDTPAA
jgi:antirestriction protein ArdC